MGQASDLISLGSIRRLRVFLFSFNSFTSLLFHVFQPFPLRHFRLLRCLFIL